MIVFTDLLLVLVLRFSFIITVEMSTDLEWSPLNPKQCDRLQQEWPMPRSTNQDTWVIPACLPCPFPPSLPSKLHSRPLPNSYLIHSNKRSFTSLTLLWYYRKLPPFFSFNSLKYFSTFSCINGIIWWTHHSNLASPAAVYPWQHEPPPELLLLWSHRMTDWVPEKRKKKHHVYPIDREKYRTTV